MARKKIPPSAPRSSEPSPPTFGVETPPATGEPAVDFEAALGQIESIIERIESGQIGLERSIGEYERGVGLIRRCREALAQAEQRVEDLTAQMRRETDAPGSSPAGRARRAGGAGDSQSRPARAAAEEDGDDAAGDEPAPF